MAEASMTEKFDRWWADECRVHRHLGFAVELREVARSAFMAGAAAESAEHEQPRPATPLIHTTTYTDGPQVTYDPAPPTNEPLRA